MKPMRFVILLNGIGHSPHDKETREQWDAFSARIAQKLGDLDGQTTAGKHVPNYGISSELLEASKQHVVEGVAEYYENTVAAQSYWVKTLRVTGALGASMLGIAVVASNFETIVKEGGRMFAVHEPVLAAIAEVRSAGVDVENIVLIGHSHGAFLVEKVLHVLAAQPNPRLPRALLLGSPLLIPSAMHVDIASDRVGMLKTTIASEHKNHVLIPDSRTFPFSHEMAAYMEHCETWLPLVQG
jgi:hypothetical protein